MSLLSNRLLGSSSLLGHWSRDLYRKLETKGRALAFFGSKDYYTTLIFHHPFSHVKAQAGTVGASLLGVIGSVKLGEEMFPSSLGHPDTGVSHPHLNLSAIIIERDGNAT